MMRIVCPTCGEEPVKGQRHICQAPPSSAVLAIEGPGQGGIRRRNGAVASAGAICSSVASLVSKQPGLWRSSKALARASSDDFVAGLLAVAAASPAWYKDPKKSVLQVFLKQVQHEAAKSVQDVWRRWRQGRRPRQKQYADGYLQLELTLPVARSRQAATAPAANVPSNGGVVASGPRQPAPGGALAHAVAVRKGTTSPASRGNVTPPASHSPRQPGTPRNKSNPRPNVARAVPMNPIQALKQRRQQKERTAEEEEEAKLKQAMEVAASMMLAERQQSSTPSAPSTPRRVPQEPPRSYPPAEIQKEVSNLSQETVSPTSTSIPSPSGQTALPPSMPAPTQRRGRDELQESSKTMAELVLQNEASSAPPTISGWRPPSATTRKDDAVRPASQQDQSATERLRERMRQREGGTSATKTPRTSAATPPAGQQSSSGSGGSAASADWKLRIEARRREAEEQQQQEQQHKHSIQERAGRRNEAMSRIIERQAQRQSEVSLLEE